MGNNLAIKVTADIIDLQSKFAVARAEVSGLTSELNKLAKESAKGTIDTAGQARLQQLAGDLLHAKSQAGQYAAEMAKAGISTSGFTSKLQQGHGAISTATREFRALFDELTSGRTQNTPGTLAIIAQRVLGLGPAALASIAGVGAIAAGLGYLAYRAIEASHALDTMHVSGLRAGNDVARSQFEQLVAQLSRLPGVSESSAQEIVRALSGVPSMTFDALAASARLAAEQMRQTGGEAKEVGKNLAQALDPARSAVDLAKSIGGLTQAQVNEAIAADRSQNVHAVLAEKIALLNVQAAKARGETDEYTHTLGQSIVKTFAWLGLAQQGMKASEITAALKKDEADAWTKSAEAVTKANSALAASPGQAPLVYDQGSVIDRMREKLAELAATWDGTQSGLLTKQRAIASQMLGEAQKNSKDYIAIQQEMARLDVQIRQAAGTEILASTRAQLAQTSGDISLSAIQRLEAERTTWEQVLAGDRLTAAQRVEVQRSLNQSIATLNKERQAQAQAIARSDTDTDLAIARLKIEAKRNALDVDVQANRVAADQKLAILRDLTNQEYQLNLQALNDQLENLRAQPLEYERVYNQIRELKARNVLDLAALDKQASIDATKQAKDQLTAWRGVVQGITQAEDQLVTNVLTGRRTLGQSLLRLGADLLTKEIQQDLQAMTTKLLLAQSEEAAKKAMSEGGFLYHLLFEQRKTAATVAGETERAAAQTAGAKAGLGISVTTALKDIAINAYRAMAGAYAAIAGIPYVGPFLAPATAAAAGYAVFKFAQNITSAEGGYDIPAGTNPMVQTHEREMILPRKYADAVREMTEGGRRGGGKARVEFIPVGADHGLVRVKDLAAWINELNWRGAT